MERMAIEDEWLSQILGESTKKAYRRQLGYFKEFMRVKSVEELIKLREKERNFETKIVQFFSWLQKDKGLTGNSARACCIPLQSLFSYVGFPIRVKNKLPRLHMRIENWKPTLKDLQGVFRLGGIEVKAWMSLSRDCPARMSDLLRISFKQVQLREFLLISKKESVVGKVYISDETKTLFEQLERAGKVLPRTQRGVDKMMEGACKVAGLKRRINQHLYRKLWITTAINLNINETATKVLAFKSVPPELLTYFLDREDLRDSWKKVVDALPLEPKSTNGNGRVATLEQNIDLVMKSLGKLLKKQMETDGIFQLPKTVGFIVEESDEDILKRYLSS